MLRKFITMLLLIIIVAAFFAFGVYIGVTQFAPKLPPLDNQPNLTSVVNTPADEASQQAEEVEIGATIPAQSTAVSAENNATATVLPENQTDSTAASPSLQSLLNSEIGIVLLAIMGLLVVLVIGFIAYFTLWQPRKKRRLFVAAQKDLLDDKQSAYEAAEQKLIKALEAGMSKKDIAEAKFALAYARSRLSKYAEAALDLANLRATGHISPESLYLELRLQLQQEEYAKAEEFYKEYKQHLLTFRDSKYLFSMAFYERAKELWNSREIEEAIRCFDTLRELGEADFIQYIPAKTDDKFVVLGILSLYAQNIKEAHDFFIEALNRQGNETTAKLGLILCDALANPEADTASKLEALVEGLQSSTESLDNHKDHILRNVLLWLLILEIKSWQKLPEKQGLPVENRKKAQNHLNAIKKLDTEFSDSYLVEGLLNYLFSKSPQERQAAIDTLKLSTEKKSGVNYADVKVLIDKELKMHEAYKNPQGELIKILTDYVKNQKVPHELRKSFLVYLEPYGIYELPDDFENLDVTTAKPTFDDIRNRGDLNYQRVQMLLQQAQIAISPENKEKIEEDMANLQKSIQSMSDERKKLEDFEHTVILKTSEVLLKEENPVKRLASSGEEG